MEEQIIKTVEGGRLILHKGLGSVSIQISSDVGYTSLNLTFSQVRQLNSILEEMLEQRLLEKVLRGNR